MLSSDNIKMGSCINLMLWLLMTSEISTLETFGKCKIKEIGTTGMDVLLLDVLLL